MKLAALTLCTLALASSTPPSDPLTPADLDAAFTEPVTAWLAEPTPENKFAVRVAALDLILSGRPIPRDLTDEDAATGLSALGLIQSIAPFPDEYGTFTESTVDDLSFEEQMELGLTMAGTAETEGEMLDALTDLRLSMPLPAVIGHGMHLVSTGIEPGSYRVSDGVRDCYWETLDASGGTIDNDFIVAAPQVIITIPADAYAFNNDCGWFVQADWTPATEPPSTTHGVRAAP